MKRTNKTILGFAVYGLPWLVVVMSYFRFGSTFNMNVNHVFTDVVLLTPTLGILMLEKRKREIFLPATLQNFYIGFFIFNGICFLLTLFLDASYFVYISTLSMFISFISVFVVYFFYSDERKKDKIIRSCNIKKKFKLLAISLLYFMMILCLIVVLCEFVLKSPSISDLIAKKDINFVLLLLNYVFLYIISLPYLFGQEFGWRVFMQTTLVQKHGLPKGILMTSLVCCVWQLPIDLFLLELAPITALFKIACSFFVYIYMGYVYDKTDNLLATITILFLNNLVSIIFFRMNDIGIKQLIVVLFVYIIAFSPFLFMNQGHDKN